MKYFLYTGVLLLFVFCAKKPTTENKALENSTILTKVDLGKKLFFDPILSSNKTISCASCHQPKFAFADNKPFSLGVNDSIGVRNAPSVMNMASRRAFFYDGRAKSLEEQAIDPIENPIEMNLPFGTAIKRIKNNETYVKLFREIYQSEPDTFSITNALAEFQRSLESDGSAPHDLWMNDIDKEAMTLSQQRGRLLFLSDEFKCFDCHFSPDFTFDQFRNIGLYDGITLTDEGRFKITNDSSDIGKFKVPGLRNVALTAPYMHNGMFKTLEEVIEFYSDPYQFVEKPINMDPLMIEPLHFTDEQKVDLVNFLHSLTDEYIPHKDLN